MPQIRLHASVRWAGEKSDPELQGVLDILSPISDRTWPSGGPEYNRNIMV